MTQFSKDYVGSFDMGLHTAHGWLVLKPTDKGQFNAAHMPVADIASAFMRIAEAKAVPVNKWSFYVEGQSQTAETLSNDKPGSNAYSVAGFAKLVAYIKAHKLVATVEKSYKFAKPVITFRDPSYVSGKKKTVSVVQAFDIGAELRAIASLAANKGKK